MKKIFNKRTLLFLITLTAFFSMAAFAADPPVKLSGVDCVKCHAKPAADIAANGGAHKTSTSCQDCHASHRPAVKNNIPQCSQCHSGKPHYNLKDCMRCHRNPHTPKIITFSNNVTAECVTCHAPQIEKLKKVKSKHSDLACSFCHSTHGKIPLCTQCHKSHSAEMSVADCKRCHQAHMPTVVTYGSDTPNKMCGACHKKAQDTLSSSDTKHKDIFCAKCHQDKHKMVPTCQNCHGEPHPAGMMNRFPKCGDCHSTAHNLNQWAPATQKLPASEKKAGKKEKKK